MTSSKRPVASASKKAIQHHYDVGNRFYSLFLDKHMIYSAALWEDGDTLEQAQIRKLDYHLDQSLARNSEHILDVGCGWGALLKRARSKYNVHHGLGLTLSEAQKHYIENLGLEDIEVRLESWENHKPATEYDAIISIGAFEHFARPDFSDQERLSHYRHFFERCWQWLKSGGRLSLQTITYDNMPKGGTSTFFSNVIFPESDLPKLGEIVEASDGLFSVVYLQNDAGDYEETCIQWANKLRSNRKIILELVGEEKYRAYYNYLALASIGFHKQNSGLIRMTLSRLDKPYRKPGAAKGE
jgi:cyclopropane-fatty-acyl-phospholipid synthase